MRTHVWIAFGIGGLLRALDSVQNALSSLPHTTHTHINTHCVRIRYYLHPTYLKIYRGEVSKSNIKGITESKYESVLKSEIDAWVFVKLVWSSFTASSVYLVSNSKKKEKKKEENHLWFATMKWNEMKFWISTIVCQVVPETCIRYTLYEFNRPITQREFNWIYRLVINFHLRLERYRNGIAVQLFRFSSKFTVNYHKSQATFIQMEITSNFIAANYHLYMRKRHLIIIFGYIELQIAEESEEPLFSTY